jgi:hypothetical protein
MGGIISFLNISYQSLSIKSIQDEIKFKKFMCKIKKLKLLNEKKNIK